MGAGAALAGSDEVDELPGQHTAELAARFFQRILQQIIAEEEGMVGLLEFLPFLAGEAGAFQANTVQAAHPVDASDDGERRQVEAYTGAALHHGESAYSAELVHHGVAGEERAVADHRVAADERAVGEDRLVADNRVMANVAVGHEKVFRPNLQDRIQ